MEWSGAQQESPHARVVVGLQVAGAEQSSERVQWGSGCSDVGGTCLEVVVVREVDERVRVGDASRRELGDRAPQVVRVHPQQLVQNEAVLEALHTAQTRSRKGESLRSARLGSGRAEPSRAALPHQP